MLSRNSNVLIASVGCWSSRDNGDVISRPSPAEAPAGGENTSVVVFPSMESRRGLVLEAGTEAEVGGRNGEPAAAVAEVDDVEAPAATADVEERLKR